MMQHVDELTQTNSKRELKDKKNEINKIGSTRKLLLHQISEKFRNIWGHILKLYYIEHLNV